MIVCVYRTLRAREAYGAQLALSNKLETNAYKMHLQVKKRGNEITS